MAKFLEWLSGFEGAAIGFLVGCIAWNYAGDKIKVWLHLKESQAGAAIKDEAAKLKSKL